MRNGVLRLFLLPLLFLASLAIQAETIPQADLHIFWSRGCPHCEKALAFLDPLTSTYPGLHIHRHELGEDPRNLQMLIQLAQRHKISEVGVQSQHVARCRALRNLRIRRLTTSTTRDHDV